MSIKTDSTDIEQETTGGLIPQLRFPEFQDDWQEKKLSNCIELISGLHLLPNEYSITGITPYFTGPSDFTKSISGIEKWTEGSSNNANANDILITVKGSGVGELWYLTLPTVAIGRQLMAIRAPGCYSQFIYQFLATKRKRFEALGSGNLIPGLSRRDILDMSLNIPMPMEQQKIADCLSIVDDLITAQRQKLETLKTHQKGLLQQLFPAEGETLPQLRVPEFQDAPEWETAVLDSKVTKVGSGITPNGGDKNYKNKGRPFVRSQNIGWGELILDDVAFIDEATHATFLATEIKEGDVLLNITGASIGRSAIADSRILGGNVNQHVCIIRPKAQKLDYRFLNQYLLSQYGQKQIDSFQAGGNRQGLNFAQIRSFSIPLPQKTTEQIKVAEFLLSIDDLIAAQSQKLGALKAHKKGLMQQLFPTPEEVVE